MATKNSDREHGRGRGAFGGCNRPAYATFRALANAGVQGAEPPEAVAILTFKMPVLGCQDLTPQHIGQHVFHLIYTDLRDDKIWIKFG